MNNIQTAASSPLVTAIITTHNRCNLLKQAIKSVFNQTYKFIECIVVDDASEDMTEDYCRNLSGIIYIRIPKCESKGGNHARNIGISNATGDLIAFLDDDDMWLPSKIEKQVSIILHDKQVGLVHCGRIIRKTSESGQETVFSLPKRKSRGDMHISILSRIYFLTSEILVKKELLLDVGNFDETIKFWQEYELAIRLCQITQVDYVNECLIIYTASSLDTNRLTNKYYEWLSSVRKIEEKHKDLYKELPLIHKIKHRIRIFSESCGRIIATNDPELIKRNSYRLFIYRYFITPAKKYLHA